MRKFKYNVTESVRDRYTHSPPNSCMPSSANMRMKRKRRNRSEIMERMLLSSEMTRFLSDDQYLQTYRQTVAAAAARRIVICSISRVYIRARLSLSHRKEQNQQYCDVTFKMTTIKLPQSKVYD